MSWAWKGDDGWVEYPEEENDKIETEFSRHSKKFKLNEQYSVDFERMIQVNPLLLNVHSADSGVLDFSFARMTSTASAKSNVKKRKSAKPSKSNQQRSKRVMRRFTRDVCLRSLECSVNQERRSLLKSRSEAALWLVGSFIHLISTDSLH
jgi:hypothetical protein